MKAIVRGCEVQGTPEGIAALLRALGDDEPQGQPVKIWGPKPWQPPTDTSCGSVAANPDEYTIMYNGTHTHVQ